MLSEQNQLNVMLFGIAFVFLIIIISVVVLFITFNNRKNKLIQENLESALENQKRQHTLELKALRGQMNPHFVHNSLNAIQYYIQRNDVETSEAYLAKFSKLMRQFFEYSRKQQITVSNEIKLLENYLQIEKLRFEESLSYQIIVDPKLDIEEAYLPSMLLQPIVENAINHGLFHKKGKGLVTIEFYFLDENSFKVTVIDDGIGINKSLLNNKKTKNEEAHASSVIEERIHFLKESKELDIVFSMVDRSSNSKLTGTEVTLIFNQPVR